LIKSENPQKVANEFNSYFASVGNSTAESVKKLAQEHHIPVIEHQALKHYPESELFPSAK
jgi:hypothetical protein